MRRALRAVRLRRRSEEEEECELDGEERRGGAPSRTVDEEEEAAAEEEEEEEEERAFAVLCVSSVPSFVCLCLLWPVVRRVDACRLLCMSRAVLVLTLVWRGSGCAWIARVRERRAAASSCGCML